MNCKIIRSLCALAVAMLLLPLSSEAKKKDGSERKLFSRGIDNTPTVFIPKGTIGTGVAFSYNEYNIGKASDDVGYQMLFSMLQGMKGNFMNWSVAPHISYFVADNISIGARFDYSRTSANLANASLAVSDDLALNVSDFNYFKHSYMGSHLPLLYVLGEEPAFRSVYGTPCCWRIWSSGELQAARRQQVWHISGYL